MAGSWNSAAALIAGEPASITRYDILDEAHDMLPGIDCLNQCRGPALYPDDPYDRARVKELIKYTELY